MFITIESTISWFFKWKGKKINGRKRLFNKYGSILKYGTAKGTYNNRLYGWLSIPAMEEEPNQMKLIQLL